MGDSPWSNQTVGLIVIDATTGFSGLFVYNGAPANGNLIASIAAGSGTDPYGNSFEAGISSYNEPFGLATVITAASVQLFSGVNLLEVLNNSGFFLYSSGAAAGNLTYSVTHTSGTDPYTNTYLEGVSTYGPVPGGAIGATLAGQLQGGVLALATAPSESGSYTNQLFVRFTTLGGAKGVIETLTVPLDINGAGVSSLILDGTDVRVQLPAYLLEQASAPATPTGGGLLYVDSTGHLTYKGPGGTVTVLANP